ncbi:hypothetical protein LB523_11635 [Mesorhizobium sp. ESP-6-4]|uniref:hypothetical protein n=1 Tax=Mesorhizobium sp. ESP-6-4 TaxID=2876624 RepID=UPI001CCEFFD7|nr:hypothetical protein [Mesorhizobium sp. ESP-6-4]MBZ9659695.1 hypothetical protein [Mesorhizobium sp. ESP-6-4]
MRIQFYGITLDLPDEWEDITDDLPNKGPPTLAKTSGVGALQFTIARYSGGEKPNADFDVLRSFMIQFCQNNHIAADHISTQKFGNIMCAGVLSTTIDKILSVWYLSNGNDFALATYLALESDLVSKELEEARAIISSISF